MNNKQTIIEYELQLNDTNACWERKRKKEKELKNCNCTNNAKTVRFESHLMRFVNVVFLPLTIIVIIWINELLVVDVAVWIVEEGNF